MSRGKAGEKTQWKGSLQGLSGNDVYPANGTFTVTLVGENDDKPINLEVL